MKSLLVLISIFLLLTSCDECMTCKKDGEVREWCDRNDINYTDQNGNIITFGELIILEESNGFNCN